MIVDYDGTTGHDTSKVQDYDGTAWHQINTVHDWNGSAYALLYQSSVTVKNLLNSAAASDWISWQDIGTASNEITVKTFTTVANHRYYVRAMWEGYSYTGTPGEFWANARFNGIAALGVGGVDSAGYYAWNSTKTGHAVLDATSTSTKATNWVYRKNSSQGGSKVTFYMVVDITDLDAAVGKHLTADECWSLFGSAVFYGSKEISV